MHETNPFARRSPSYRDDKKGRTKCEKVIYHQNEPICTPCEKGDLSSFDSAQDEVWTPLGMWLAAREERKTSLLAAKRPLPARGKGM